MTFMPGQSGNPGGRPNSTIRELARQHSTEAVETLAKIMKAGRSDRARILATNSLLDRAWGKPTQPIGGDPEEPLVIHEHRAASLLRYFASLPPEEATARVRMLDLEQAEEVRCGWARIRAREEQVAPPGEWRIWLLLAGRRFGKALALDTAIPNGWSTMGRLRVGDEVYDENVVGRVG